MNERGRKDRAAAVEWPTVFLVFACYGVWLAAGIWLWPSWPLAALGLMALTVALQDRKSTRLNSSHW